MGNGHKEYQPDRVRQDIDSLRSSDSYREGLGVFDANIVQQFFDAHLVHKQILGTYRLIILYHSLNKGVEDSAINTIVAGSGKSDNRKADVMLENEIEQPGEKLLQAVKDNVGKLTRDLIIVQNRLYAQLESLSWLQRRLAIKAQLPPLRGWAASPDVLLRLHAHIMATRPKTVVELGSGASTVVIADALRQNDAGKLISIEHSEYYGAQTLASLQAEKLQMWVDLRIGELEPWEGKHLNPQDSVKPSRWYALGLLEDLRYVDLLWIDGPPGATCRYSRYPALPALMHRLSSRAEVWLDDTVRQEEKEICERWAQEYGFDVEYYSFEKGLGRLTRPQTEGVIEASLSLAKVSFDGDELLEDQLGLDFSLPEEGQE